MSDNQNPKTAADNRANQLNPNNPLFAKSRGFETINNSEFESQMGENKAAMDNRANQLNPNNPAFAKSRGFETVNNP